MQLLATGIDFRTYKIQTATNKSNRSTATKRKRLLRGKNNVRTHPLGRLKARCLSLSFVDALHVAKKLVANRRKFTSMQKDSHKPFAMARKTHTHTSFQSSVFASGPRHWDHRRTSPQTNKLSAHLSGQQAHGGSGRPPAPGSTGLNWAGELDVGRYGWPVELVGPDATTINPASNFPFAQCRLLLNGHPMEPEPNRLGRPVSPPGFEAPRLYGRNKRTTESGCGSLSKWTKQMRGYPPKSGI